MTLAGEDHRPSCNAAPPRIALVLCAVLEIEAEHYGRGLEQLVHVEKLEQGLHNDPPLLRRKLQQAIDQVEAAVPEADTIALGYGLCSRGTEGVRTRRCRLVMPRAHDCITLLLGSKERYADYVARNPGTYWYSPGWNKHHVPPGPERYRRLYDEYVEKYGSDNAEYLMESEQHWFQTYDRATYVDLTIGATEQDLRYTRDCADWLKWQFDHQRGDPDLLQALMSGRWDGERFIVCEPGQAFEYSGDDGVVRKATV